MSGSPLSNAGAVAAGTWVEFDVSSVVTGEGIYSFGLNSASTNNVKYSSKEGANPPQLVLEINLPPAADFSGTPTSGDSPLAVTFSDQSTNGPTEWDWDFGDGNSSIEQHPVHTYTVPGTYAVTLTAGNPLGSDTLTKIDYITVNEPEPAIVTCVLPSQDAYINQDNPSDNKGDDNDLKVKPDAGKERRILIEFDLASIPANSNVLDATLFLYEDNKKDNQTIHLHRMTNSWDERQVTWADRSAGTPWSTPGGDYDAATTVATFIPDVDNQYREIDVTSVTQAWVNGSDDNYGLLLRSTGDNGEVKFKSKEEGNEEKRPQLCVMY
jgi:PKD repeat protein